MDQRLVKPIFWPVLLLSCVALSVTTFFLIGGMISSRGEDYFISAVVGFILFLIARNVQTNVAEPPKTAIFLMFFVIALVAVLVVFVMNNALVHTNHVNFAAFEGHRLHGGLAYMPRGVRWLSHYRDWATNLTAAGFTLTGLYVALHRAIYLSYGIMAGVIFIVLQAATCALLFIGTNPKKKNFRH